ncbi:GntR family transcriptional regulator [Bradyrhizobium sp.]|uniref:GntR family transcriptional regulator n=1 Tax=Bradyrhizobium sp. TaxID=376 RepID=UPI003C498EF0
MRPAAAKPQRSGPAHILNARAVADGARRLSLRDQAYEAIKHDIITCALRPGEYINESLLSERLRFGRTPVHQAIDQLKLQGLVDIIPRKGIIVRPVNLAEIMQVAEVRMINEMECARLAAVRATKSDIAAMRDILANADEARSTRDIEALMMLDRDFHGMLAQAAKNPVLSELLRTLHERSLRVWFISLNDAEHLKKVQREHEAIVDALVAGDADRAAAAMREHILSYRSNIARHVDPA